MRFSLFLFSCVSVMSFHLAKRFPRFLNRLSSSITFGDSPTVESAYNTASKWLNSLNIPDSEESARHMICEAGKLGYRQSDFIANQKKILSDDELQLFESFCIKRSTRMPIQYVIGNWDFYGLTLECRPPILIPRPETEELVSNIIDSNVLQSITAPRILDIGAGTGAIGLALVSQIPTVYCKAIDINPNAVELANSNAIKVLHGNTDQRYECVHSSFMDYVSSVVGKDQFDLIVSNPPYIPSKEILELEKEVKDNEDIVALDGGIDGLDIVYDIITHFPLLLSKSGSRELWLEVSREHPEAVKQWLANQHSDNCLTNVEFVESINDFTGNPRFIRLKAH